MIGQPRSVSGSSKHGEVPLELLKNISLLQDMNDDERRQIASIGTLEQFQPGELIVRHRETSQNLWVVVEGECEVVRTIPPASGATHAAPVVLATLGPCQEFGDMSFFHAAPHSADVRAKSPVTLLRIARPDYDRLANTGSRAAHKLVCNTVKTLSERLRRMDDWVVKLMGLEASSPIKSEILRMREKVFESWIV